MKRKMLFLKFFLGDVDNNYMNRSGFTNIIPILESNDVEFAGIFGSYAKGDEKKDSDIDMLVRFRIPKSLFDIVGLELELSAILKRKVDLVTERALCPHIKENVLKDLQLLYERR